MATVEIFDPAMCCSTGVCGPSVDPTLARFAADLDWLGQQPGVQVSRATLSQQPDKFVAAPAVLAAMHEHGDTALPAVLVDGDLRSTGRYPDRDELSAWTGLTPSADPASARQLPQAGGCCGGGSC